MFAGFLSLGCNHTLLAVTDLRERQGQLENEASICAPGGLAHMSLTPRQGFAPDHLPRPLKRGSSTNRLRRPLRS